VRIALSGGEVEKVYQHLNAPSDLDFDGPWMYWCDWANGDVIRAPVPEAKSDEGWTAEDLGFR